MSAWDASLSLHFEDNELDASTNTTLSSLPRLVFLSSASSRTFPQVLLKQAVHAAVH